MLCYHLKTESIENFDPNELKISSDEIKEYKSIGMRIIFNHDRKIMERREFSLEYKGGKPKFRADGRLYHLIYPGQFPEEE